MNTIQTELSEMDLVDYVSADVVSKEVTVRFADPESEARILSLLEEIGYSAANELS